MLGTWLTLFAGIVLDAAAFMWAVIYRRRDSRPDWIIWAAVGHVVAGGIAVAAGSIELWRDNYGRLTPTQMIVIGVAVVGPPLVLWWFMTRPRS